MSPMNPEQKYITLIFETSNYYASWDPRRPVRLGDYGHLQKDLSFAPEGNIFDDGLAAEFGLHIADNGHDEDRWIEAVRNRKIKFWGEVAGGHPIIAEARFKKNFTISNTFGAALAMLDPTHTSIANAGHLKHLIWSTAFSDEHVLVSELYTCQSYARLLAPRQQRTVEVTLDGSAHARMVHGQVGLQWETTAEGGDFKFSHNESHEMGPPVQPLFRLVGRRMSGFAGLSRPRRPVAELTRPRWRRVIMRHAYAMGVDISDDEWSDDNDSMMLPKGEEDGFDDED